MRSFCAITALMLCYGPFLPQSNASAQGVCCYETWSGHGCVTINEFSCEMFWDGTWYPDQTCAEFHCEAQADLSACCIGNECLMMLVDECLDMDGAFYHNETSCDSDLCVTPPSKGACCDADVPFGDGCVFMYEEDCNELGGTYQGDWTTCETSCSCPGDLDNDQIVGVDDLLTVLSEFGLDCTTGCVSDFDDSGSVDIDDLLTMLSYYGLPCS